ncbi:MAG: carboxypeptidase regulatory-like domain-containing protein, partial [Methylobacteriaceae bacterium]|nr:carboxypeptidase regulatory-like domain-containing protein [Methylobacteriaceae bacterium]
MKIRRPAHVSIFPLALSAFVLGTPESASAQTKAEVAVSAVDIGGRVSGPNGTEAGVWVIAETTDLPTKFAKIVVTDDQGRFVIPDVPSANYKIWSRGYGLVDSDKQDARPGAVIDIAAKPAPNEAAAAKYYPGVYWYSLMKIPPAREFPGSDNSPTGMPASMHSQADWIDTVKNSCQSCHALGSKNVRSPSKDLGTFSSSVDLWTRRLQSGQAMSNMAVTMTRLGPERGLEMFADWTDRIAAGELPFEKPERPKGVERNVVVSLWDWGTPTMYLHDAIS